MRRSRLTAKTAREGSPSDEQADLTETQTPSSLSSRWKTVPLTSCTLRFRMWGMAFSGLLMRTLGYLASAVRRNALAFWTASACSGSCSTASSSASASEALKLSPPDRVLTLRRVPL